VVTLDQVEILTRVLAELAIISLVLSQTFWRRP